MMQKIYNYLKEKGQKGQSIIEYGLLIAVVAAALFAVSSDGGIGKAFNGVFGKVSSEVDNAVPAAHENVHSNITSPNG